MKILVTGSAGFIGYHVAKRLLERGDDVVGVDNMSDYYDVTLKESRLAELKKFRDQGSGTRDQDQGPGTRDQGPGKAVPGSRSQERPSQVPGPRSPVPNKGRFTFVKLDISDRAAVEQLFSENSFDRVIHMAAQAGVRYSLTNPHAYVQSNIVGFLNILEACRHQWTGSGTRDQGPGNAVPDPRSPIPGPGSQVPGPRPRHLVFASSSSVYGLNTKLPFSTSDNVDHPISLYAATKKAGELMAHTYAHLYGIPCTGLRFFTVYGPYGRPDMAYFKFTKAIMNGEPIDVYNEGRMRRDFTYIDDIVEGILRVSDKIPESGTRNQEPGKAVPGPRSPVPDPRSLVPGPDSRVPSPSASVRPSPFALSPDISPTAPYKIYNIGNHSPVELLDFIRAIEEALDKKAKLNMLPMQPGDVAATYADVDDLSRDVGFAPKTSVKEGIKRFVEWYRSYYA